MIEKIRKIVAAAAAGEEFEIRPSENGDWHYSTNAALKAARKRGRPAFELAQELAEKIKSKSPKGFFEKVEAASPGFVNFWLTPAVFRAELKEILKKKKNYGRAKRTTRKKVQLEFVSANPTGPLTLANGRGGFFGDVLANILEFGGRAVEREYYVNDAGNQILILGRSLLAAAGLIEPEINFYQGNYIKEWAKKHAAAVKKHRNAPMKLGQAAANNFLGDIKGALKTARIRFDRFTSEEKDIRRKSYVAKILKIFQKKRVSYEKENALWLKTSRFGDDKDRVLVTGDGYPTYFLADAGHYLETKERGFAEKINILGPDHYGYAGRIQAVAKTISLKSKIVITQAVRLSAGGKKTKMSKRGGQFATFEELVGEVGRDAARFFFLMYSPETHLNFDLKLAKERSLKNPVYYLQYAAVRCQSVIRKSKVSVRSKKINLDLLNTPEDLNLMRLLARFPEAAREAAENLAPQTLVRYALELARAFHNFYEKEKVIGEDRKLTLARLVLINAAQTVFKNLFGLLGVGLPEKM